jgi:hypothetical protein
MIVFAALSRTPRPSVQFLRARSKKGSERVQLGSVGRLFQLPLEGAERVGQLRERPRPLGRQLPLCATGGVRSGLSPDASSACPSQVSQRKSLPAKFATIGPPVLRRFTLTSGQAPPPAPFLPFGRFDQNASFTPKAVKPR